MTREPIYSAFFALFAGLIAGGSPAFKTTTRRVKLWEQVAPEDTPALLMREVRETAEYRKGLPIKWSLEVELLLYVHTGAYSDTTIVPTTILNPLLDAVANSMSIDDPAMLSTTLGGLVSHAAISGPIEIFEGALGDDAVALIPVNLLATP